MPKLSIIICTRNRQHALQPMLDALGALRSAQSFEILLVDNASTDDTRAHLDREAVRLPHAHVITVGRVGLGAARDAAWRVARGDILLFTDDDCYVASDLVERTVALFDQHPEIDFAGGRILLHDPADLPVTIDERTVACPIAARRFVPPGTLQGANMAFRRSALERIGGFDPRFGAGTAFPCEDIDAVAACVWAGLTGRFDPSIVVRHHHGRKQSDYPALMAGYDRGRGAYYAKYLLRPASRSAYAAGWLAATFRNLHRGNATTLARELKSARRYLIARRAWGALAVGSLAAAIVFGGLWSAILLNKLRLASGIRPRTPSLEGVPPL